MNEFEDLPLFRPTDPRLHPDEKPRLSAQCQKILDRLRQGSATNKELAFISLKYTGRISDLRAAGYVIEVIHRDHKTGLTFYQLRSEP